MFDCSSLFDPFNVAMKDDLVEYAHLCLACRWSLFAMIGKPSTPWEDVRCSVSRESISTVVSAEQNERMSLCQPSEPKAMRWSSIVASVFLVTGSLMGLCRHASGSAWPLVLVVSLYMIAAGVLHLVLGFATQRGSLEVAKLRRFLPPALFQSATRFLIMIAPCVPLMLAISFVSSGVIGLTFLVDACILSILGICMVILHVLNGGSTLQSSAACGSLEGPYA